jgi:hypothetical protein
VPAQWIDPFSSDEEQPESVGEPEVSAGEARGSGITFDGELELAFDTDDPEFARGVEAGLLWERARIERDPFEETVHLTNAEMMLRIADALGRPVASTELDDTWMTVRFEARP